METEQIQIQKNEKEDKKTIQNETEMKVFDLFDISKVEIKDPGLKNIINLDYKLVLKSHGRIRERFGKANINIIERLINMLAVPGHRGKKHKLITRWATGKYNTNTKIVIEAFKIIEKKTGKNPIQVLVEAIENGSPRDEVTMIQYGGARYPQAVDCSPHRRVSLVLRNIIHGAQDKAFNKKKPIVYALADEIIATANQSGDSVAYTKKNELEKQADAAR
ncbi:MAG: 30S ribosomal protein S7 [Candidatus Pacearchaeota archaeon]